MKFKATIGVGHGNVHYVEVPFHPKDEWQLEPVKIPRPQDPRGGKGWLVRGTIDGVKFEGHIGHRYGRAYLIIDEELRKLAGVAAGDEITVSVKPLNEKPVSVKPLNVKPVSVKPLNVKPLNTAAKRTAKPRRRASHR